MANCIFRFRAHLCTGNLEAFRTKDWVIAKSLISDRAVKNPTIEARFLNMRSAIWQSQRCNACEVRTALFIRNSN
jgi:hypothetical protein